MKISGPGGAGPVPASARTQAAAGGFAPSETESAAGPAAQARVGAAGAVGSLDALLALQETGGPLERRRRAIRRADRALDGLDALKLALVEGGPAGGALAHLQAANGELRERTDDLGLESLLDQVDLRVAVELAKREPRRVAA